MLWAGSKGNLTLALMLCAGSKGKAKTEGESEDDVPFMAQEERRPLRARKTMQLQDVDSKLRDMRYAFCLFCCPQTQALTCRAWTHGQTVRPVRAVLSLYTISAASGCCAFSLGCGRLP